RSPGARRQAHRRASRAAAARPARSEKLTAAPTAGRDPEERPGSAGALPSAGELGGPVAAPHLVTDAQIHLWAADTPARPWPPGGAQRAHQPQAVGKDQALAAMKDAGGDRAVIVPPSWAGERNDLAL